MGRLPLLLTIIFSALPSYIFFLYVFKNYFGEFAEITALWIVAFLWGLLVFLSAVRVTFFAPAIREYLAIIGIAFLLTWLAWDRLFLPEIYYSYNPEHIDLFTQIDREKIYYQQPRLLAKKLKKLKPETPGESDVYFVGFAGNGDEAVFRSEVNFVRNLTDRNFKTKGRSISLVNNLERLTEEPLANIYNLDAALKEIGNIMDVGDDVLFLFLTSHGSDDAKLQVSLYPFELKSLSSLDLRRFLDEAGILWRVIVISACYSGSFIDSLANDRTLIMSAAASDKKSFGCSNDRDLTYFGEALFGEELFEESDLIGAFQGATESIRERELGEGLDPSNPQIYVGALIRDKLESIWPKGRH